MLHNPVTYRVEEYLQPCSTVLLRNKVCMFLLRNYVYLNNFWGGGGWGVGGGMAT